MLLYAPHFFIDSAVVIINYCCLYPLVVHASCTLLRSSIFSFSSVLSWTGINIVSGRDVYDCGIIVAVGRVMYVSSYHCSKTVVCVRVWNPVQL
jgi:hypothetical protein